MTENAFIFPGQGSQSVGMLTDLIDNHDVVKETLVQASDVLGTNLLEMILNGPSEDLNRTDNTQPALLAASVALYRLWLEKGGIKPSKMAGHSLGEYSALVCSGVIDFEDAVRLVSQRGQFMMQAVPAGTGAMAAILGLEDAQVEKACLEAAQNEVVSAVNYNSPGQLVIAGNKDAVDRAIEICKTAGAKRALPLPVSVPSHCELMKPAAEKLAEILNSITFSAPEIDVINNVDVKIESAATTIKNALVRQLYSPVRWTETIQEMQKDGISTLIEFGPGKVLTGLNKRIDRSLTALSTNDQTAFNKSMEAMN